MAEMPRGPTHQPPPEEADRGASARATAWAGGARVLLALLAAAAAVFALLHSRPLQPAGRHPTYACPMHHQVTASGPGNCPICGMALEALEEPHRTLSSTADALAHVTHNAVDVVRRRTLVHQVHAPAWLEADGTVRAVVYGDDAATLEPDEEGLFHPAATSAAALAVRRLEGPLTPWDDSSVQIRFRPARTMPALAAGTTGWLDLPVRSRPTLVIPSAAVLQSADGPYVLALSARGAFTRRPVRIGRTRYGLAMVLSGLREDERIAVRTAFFLDAERRLSAGADAAGP